LDSGLFAFWKELLKQTQSRKETKSEQTTKQMQASSKQSDKQQQIQTQLNEHQQSKSYHHTASLLVFPLHGDSSLFSVVVLISR
jgi:hypothetical protein